MVLETYPWSKIIKPWRRIALAYAFYRIKGDSPFPFPSIRSVDLSLDSWFVTRAVINSFTGSSITSGVNTSLFQSISVSWSIWSSTKADVSVAGRWLYCQGDRFSPTVLPACWIPKQSRGEEGGSSLEVAPHHPSLSGWGSFHFLFLVPGLACASSDKLPGPPWIWIQNIARSLSETYH